MEAMWLVLPDSELSKDGKPHERTEFEIDKEFRAADRGKMEAWNREMTARNTEGRMENFIYRTKHWKSFSNFWPTTDQDRIDLATWQKQKYNLASERRTAASARSSAKN